MKEISVSQAKQILLEILQEFHQFCHRENLRYSLYAGSLIGALRHQGFIPWDDDIDVLMPREDYERLCHLYRTSPHPAYLELNDSRTRPGYFYPFMKLEDTRTIMIGKGKKRVRIGLHIDIFPLDGMPKSLIAANAYLYLHRLFRHAATLASLHLRVKGRSLPKQLFLFMFKTLTLGATSARWNKISHWIARRYSWEKSRWAGNVIWGYGTKEKVPGAYYQGNQAVPFEGFQFDAMGNADGYLRCVYGNYMAPPPPEKRIPGHITPGEIYIKNFCSVPDSNQSLSRAERP